jgi:hypothetical protein
MAAHPVAIGPRSIVVTLLSWLDVLMTESVPLRPGDKMTIRTASAAERESMNLAVDEPIIQIYRQDGTVEIYGSLHVDLLVASTELSP